jgi:hypothetical protein
MTEVDYGIKRRRTDVGDGHALACLSYFEFHDAAGGLYMGKYALDDEDVGKQSRVKAPVLSGLVGRCPFAGVSETDVRNFVDSLTGSSPAILGRRPSDVPDYAASGRFFEFGFNDMLGWLIAEAELGSAIPKPTSASSLVAYLNKLEITGVRATANADDQPMVDAKSEGFNAIGLYVRETPKGQRAMDVIPLILYAENGENKVATTLGSRKRTAYVFDDAALAAAGFSGLIVGGGEHLEREDKTTIQNTAAGMDIDTDPGALPREVSSAAATRAIKEEVGIPDTDVQRARFFVVGVHQTTTDAVVGRELRYWPRVFQGRAYGYRRAASTIIIAAIMDADVRALVLRPEDTNEIAAARVAEWGDVVANFRYGAGYKYEPAFGWSHTRMIEYVNSKLGALMSAFSSPRPVRRTGLSFGFRGMDYHTAAQIHHEAKAQAYGSMRKHRKAASHEQRAADHMRFGAEQRAEQAQHAFFDSRR